MAKSRIFKAIVNEFALLPALAQAQTRAHVNDGVDLFVLELFDRIQPASIARNRVHCGLIAFDAEEQLVTVSETVGDAAACTPAAAPAGYDVIAAYRTHGAFLGNARSELPTVAEYDADARAGTPPEPM